MFGIGGENMCITINAFVSKWFLGQEVSIALAIVVSAAGLGMVVSGLVSSQIFDVHNNIDLPLYIAIYVMLGGWLIIAVMCYIDRRAQENDDRVLQQDGQGLLLADSKEVQQAQAETDTDQNKLDFRDILSFPKLYWMLCLSMITMYGQFIPFQNNLQRVLEVKYKVSADNASK